MLLIKYEGELSTDSKYVNASIASTATIEAVIRTAYKNHALERILEDDKKLEFEM